MRKQGAFFELSATDLVDYLKCRHLSALERAVAEDNLKKPHPWDPLLKILWERGSIHEQNYVEHLTTAGLEVVRIDGFDVSSEAVTATIAAMRRGAQIIAQGAFSHQRWVGRADILRRIEVPSLLGSWSYEAIDTKLARETKAGAVLQLCLYSDLIKEVQGLAPEHMFVVVPWSDFEPQRYRFADYAAYFRRVKRELLKSLSEEGGLESYPDPNEHCETCGWRKTCEQRRRDDDHLCLVAGISKLQINELTQHGTSTMKALAGMALPLDWKPDRGSAGSYTRVRQQARIQVEARETGQARFELLPVEAGFGLTCLPEPSEDDIFLDLEGDPFAGEQGLEYLFGYLSKDGNGALAYQHNWAFSRADEKHAFEGFVDFVMARWAKFPDLHIYHYAPYEPAALKRLMGRYATREEELDQMLRGKLFVDLYQVVRHGIRAGVESYSIKRLEPLYAYSRNTALPDANAALALLQANIELDDISSISEGTKSTVVAYNRDDCQSAAVLRDWLEGLRDQIAHGGTAVPRPKPGDSAPNEKITDWLIRINAVIAKLTADIPADPEERTTEQQARWILANVIDWHRREEKAVWWEYFRLSDLSVEDLLDEKCGLSGLSFVGEVGGTARAPIHRYRFPPQETEIRGGEGLRNIGGERFGAVEAISFEVATIDIKKRQDTANLHPEAVFAHSYVDPKIMAESLLRIGTYVAEHGLLGGGPYRAARDLLLREMPRTGEQPLHCHGESTVEAAVRLCSGLRGGILPIQGPPGAGKTYTGAQMICELVRRGKTVGITANSHKVIRNLIDAAVESARKHGLNLHCCQKPAEMEDAQPHLSFARSNKDLFAALGNTAMVGAGTAWLWAAPEAFETVDVLFVDEAAQMSLANVLAVSQAAKTVVLIGDPRQLDQPMQGSHPEGTDVSALDHILSGQQTISPDQGLFLEQTWRLHPDICAFTSELFYDGKLSSRAGLELQVINAAGPICGSGLRYLPVIHRGNRNSAPEEASAVGVLVGGILESNATWVDRDGQQRLVTLDDIVIITPYNAQVFEIQRRLPGARVGTVDKFQGQEAPIAIYSTATSSPADAPRGMEFLYSLNRLNVATSRAKCVCIMVGSPELFEAECRTPRQAQLANAFCRILELAHPLP
jgi:predicted RecB family nuclease